MVPPSQDTSRQNSSPPPSLHLGVLTPPPKCEQEAQLSWPLSVDMAKSGEQRDLPRARHMPLVIRRGCRSPRQRKKALFLKFSSSLLGGAVVGVGVGGLGTKLLLPVLRRRWPRGLGRRSWARASWKAENERTPNVSCLCLQ